MVEDKVVVLPQYSCKCHRSHNPLMFSKNLQKVHKEVVGVGVQMVSYQTFSINHMYHNLLKFS